MTRVANYIVVGFLILGLACIVLSVPDAAVRS